MLLLAYHFRVVFTWENNAALVEFWLLILFCAPYAPPYATAVQPSRFVVGQRHAFAPPMARRDGYIPLPNAVVVNGGMEW